MHPIAVILVLISAFTHALLSLLIKKSNDKGIFVWAYYFFGSLIFLPVFLYYLSSADISFDSLGLVLLFSGLAHCLYVFTFAKAFQTGDLSLVYPVIRTSPALVLIGSIFILGEEISLLGASGVILTVLGVYLLFIEPSRLRLLVSPFVSVFKSQATRYAALTAGFSAIYTMIDKMVVSQVSPLLYIYFLFFVIAVGLGFQVLLSNSREAIYCEISNNFKYVILCSFLDMGGYLLVLIALTFDKASYVVGLRQVSIIIAVLMGGVLLGETNRRKRFWAAAVIFIGALMISFAE